uniref:Reverse transcriptase domain-containing protein n=1 Tax=Tanacetum cinerariifolium TaxID=118510 RepID=A0A6L2MC33_TANCI|nr:reverse transcriptase domain-containing protein [Tanacetum cinerariifolium]
MCIDELEKFTDGTLNDVRTTLDDRLNGIRMQYLSQTIWRGSDKDREATMIQAIDKQLKTRRIMRNLENFIAGNPVKEILIKLNLPDRRSTLTDSQCMRARSSSNLPGEYSPNLTSLNPKHRNHRRSKQPFFLEESPVDKRANQRIMAELLRAPTEGYAEAIVVSPILAEHFELKHRVARRWLEKEPSHSILTWVDLVSKFINELFPPSRTTNLRNEISNFQQRFDELFHEAWDRYKDLIRACPNHGFTELHQLDTFNNALNLADQDSLNYAAGGNMLERRTQDVLTIIENKSKFSHPQGYNRGNNFNQDLSYQAPMQQNQVVPLSELEKIKKMNEINMEAMQTQINNVKNEIRNEMKTSIQASMSNQTNKLKNMMASFFQMNTTSTSGSRPLPSNTIANPKGELKVITTRSGIVLDGPFVPMPPPFINPEEDEHVEETLTDPDLTEYTIKVPPPLVQKPKPPSKRNYMVHQRDPLHPNIPYPLRMHKQKQQDKDEGQMHKFWQMFMQLHINITLVDALILIPKYQKILKTLLSNKEKLLELANAPLNEK